MKIPIKDRSNNGEVFVWGVYGPKSLKHQLDLIDQRVAKINDGLRKALYEQN